MPPNLMTSVFSLVNKPTVIIKSAKELEEEKKEAARKKIEEKEVKSQQVLNKKKQREMEVRLHLSQLVWIHFFSVIFNLLFCK